MEIDEVRTYVAALGNVLTLEPGPGDGSPEVAWGDLFFYYSPEGVVPRTQPFATVVTKDYPGEPSSDLDRPGAFRVNVAVGATEFRRRTGRDPRDLLGDDVDPRARDVVLPHPVYARLGWLAVVEPGPRTEAALRDLLRLAHGLAGERHGRRTGD